jgi:predicted DNA-binding transcriptional regulator YafY
MLEFQTKIKRQIEILGYALDDETHLRPADVADMYRCEELTIQRDLGDLRAHGIDIHTRKKEGIHLAQPLPPKTLALLIRQYLGLCGPAAVADKGTSLLVKRWRAKALLNIVLIQRSIEERRVLIIDYEKEAGVFDLGCSVYPLLIFESEGSWRVLARHNDRMKQYHLNKITAITPTRKNFPPVPQEQIDDMFRFSFRSWLGTERFHVRIKLQPPWPERIKPRQLMESQVITEEADGTVIFETTVNSLDEIASWVVSRGRGVIVLEPEALKQRVLDLAQGVLQNYTATAP